MSIWLKNAVLALSVTLGVVGCARRESIVVPKSEVIPTDAIEYQLPPRDAAQPDLVDAVQQLGDQLESRGRAVDPTTPQGSAFELLRVVSDLTVAHAVLVSAFVPGAVEPGQARVR